MACGPTIPHRARPERSPSGPPAVARQPSCPAGGGRRGALQGDGRVWYGPGVPPLRLRVGPFGVKDLFTIVNLLGGIAGIYFVLEGQAQLAGFAAFAGYLFGDTLDGPVARLTRTSNKFGSEFDTATDHFTQAIVPSIIVFAVYAQHGHRMAGVVLMAVIV